MGKQSADMSGKIVLALVDDVKRVLGHLDGEKLVDIIALRPTVKDVEEASLWLAGDADVFGRGAPLKATAARIVEIVTADEEDEPQA